MIENKKKLKKRILKVPISDCYSMSQLSGEIATVNYYETMIDNVNYLIDIISTKDKRFYVRMTDITNNRYEEIDFDKFKMKYKQPTLFDLWNI